MNNITRILALLAVLVGFSPLLSAQQIITKKTATGSAKKFYDKGMAAYNQDDNATAIAQFGKAIKSEPKFIDAHILQGVSYYDLKNFKLSEEAFERAIALDKTYMTKAIFKCARAEMMLQKYSEAQSHFSMYQELEVKNKILIDKARKHQSKCSFMIQAFENRVPFAPKKLDATINTDKAEYLPALTADGNTMIFTRRIGSGVWAQEDFFISRKVDGAWRLSRPLEDINTELNEAAQSISADGKFLVYTACNREDGLGSCDLFFTEVKNGRWSKSKNMGENVNTKAWESQPSISADGKTLFFASNRGGGFGKEDIWMSKRNSKGEWSNPINLGPTINSSESEQSPFIHADGETLYFMSNGWPGMGMHDLYFSRFQENNQWALPTNLGFPINTKVSEGAMVISLDGKTAFFASDRDQKTLTENFFDNPKGKGDTDIYSFELYEEARPNPVTYVKARVHDAKSKTTSLVANVEFVDLESGKIHSSSETDEEGEFLVCLPLGKNYSLNVSKEKYLFHSENFSLNKNLSGKPYVLEIGLRKIPPKEIVVATLPPSLAPKPIILRNVFFDVASAKLRPESSTELNLLVELLQENAEMAIKIQGHTDDDGTDADNLKLSDDRAKAVYSYLIDKGIAASRLAFQGFGENQPIASNETKDGKQQNRRTEFVITRN